jgi:hypothetical protein
MRELSEIQKKEIIDYLYFAKWYKSDGSLKEHVGFEDETE